MYIEEVFLKLSENHIKRCYRALLLTDKMIELYKKRTNENEIFHPEDLEDEFYNIIEEFLEGGDKE